MANPIQRRLLTNAIITFDQESEFTVFDAYNLYQGAPMATWGGIIESNTLYSKLNATRQVQELRLRRKGLFQELYEEVLPKLVSEGVNQIITETRIPSTARFFLKNKGEIKNLGDLSYSRHEIGRILSKGGHGEMPFTLRIETAIASPLLAS